MMQPLPENHRTDLLSIARGVIEMEGTAVLSLQHRIDERFVGAVHAMLECRSRVVVTGMGKSGHIGHKIAATLASTGTPAFFVHPGDAAHGDLGMITPTDVVLAISNSGESDELTLILPIIKRHGTTLVCITSRPSSTLARASDICLDLGVTQEADPLGLAPTTSTTAALALGDALAVALLSARGFSHDDFARSHPSGALGRRLLLRCKDVMRTGAATPRVPPSATVAETLLETTQKGLGLCVIADPDTAQVLGVFTDGDLRRMLETRIDVHATAIAEIMTRSPHTIEAESLAVEALRLFEQFRINALPVVAENHTLVGALNMHDLLRAGVA